MTEITFEQRHMLPVIIQSKGGQDYTDLDNKGIVIEPSIIDLGDTLNLIADGVEYIDKKKTSYSYSGYNPQNNDYNCWDGEIKDERTIYFYEWSNHHNVPKIFQSVTAFSKWAEENDVKISDYSLESLKKNVHSYVSCYSGSHYCFIRATYNALKKEIEYEENRKNNAKLDEHYPRDYNYYDDDYWD